MINSIILPSTRIFNNYTADKKIKVTEKKHNTKTTDTNKIAGAVLATALAAATITGFAVSHNGKVLRNKLTKKYKKDIQDINKLYSASQNQNKNLKKQNSKTKKSYHEMMDEFADLIYAQENLKEENKELKLEKEKLASLLKKNIGSKDFFDKVYKKFETKIAKGDYGYDISQPPITGKRTPPNYANAVELPKSTGTNNRANMIDLKIPEIRKDGSFKFELPVSGEMKIEKTKSINFQPETKTTNVTESYADSVKWNSDKIARDLLQNFFDGHGQTLDGVKFLFVPQNGRYKVRIEGKSTYAPDKAIYIGESTKRDNLKAAGNYGEGLKMAVLKVLKDYGAENFVVASNNWKLDYSLQKSNLSSKRILAYALDKVDEFDGNFIEFETDNKNLLKSLRKTINRFYHSNNKDFQCPDFENEHFGIKILKPKEKGGFYIAGQQFEYENSFEGLNGISIFLKQKPPSYVIDISRDRMSLTFNHLKNLGKYYSGCSMPITEQVNLLKALEPYWNVDSTETALDAVDFLVAFLENKAKHPDLFVKFPKKYLAYSDTVDIELEDSLIAKGYILCHTEFSNIGMISVRDMFGDAVFHDVVIPNEIQKKKILILKEAINKLSSSLKYELFNPDEIDAKIYMFDAKKDKYKIFFSNVYAEAIIDNCKSKGFWLEKSYLDKTDFSDVLETALHELCHKAGGDGSQAFSYKLTNVNSSVFEQLLNDPETLTEILALQKLWNSL